MDFNVWRAPNLQALSDAAARASETCDTAVSVTAPSDTCPQTGHPGRSRMKTNLKRLIRWSVPLACLTAIGFAGHTLFRLAPIATGYAAKTL